MTSLFRRFFKGSSFRQARAKTTPTEMGELLPEIQAMGA